MLGRFLEFSVSAEPLAAAVEAYASLGFRSVPVGDIVPGAYAVVSDGAVFIGLHDVELDGLTTVFVRPGLKEHVRALRRCGVEFESLALADDEFHQARFRDPGGMLISLVEARTFSARAVTGDTVSPCGEFVELSIATHSIRESRAFWSALGFEEDERGRRDDHLESGARDIELSEPSRLSAHGLTIGLHETSRFRTALTFSASNLRGRVEYLRAKGFKLRDGTPLTDDRGTSATLLAPGNVEIYLVDTAQKKGSEPFSDNQ